MPSLLEKLAPELQSMILPHVLQATFGETPPALITDYHGNSFQKVLLAWFEYTNGTITASTRLEWLNKTLAETKRVEHLLIICYPEGSSGATFWMPGDKMLMVNHLRTLSIDISHFSEVSTLVGYLAQYLLRASRRPEKVVIRALATTVIHMLKVHLDEGLGPKNEKDPKGVIVEHVIMPATPDQPVSYQYLTWEARRLVWSAKKSVAK